MKGICKVQKNKKSLSAKSVSHNTYESEQPIALWTGMSRRTHCRCCTLMMSLAVGWMVRNA